MTAALGALSLVCTAVAAEPKQAGWILEHFGRDVSILRTQRDPAAIASSGQLFLSCEGRDIRLRIELPDRLAGGADIASKGILLLRPSGMAEGPFVVFRYSAQHPRTLLIRMDGLGADGRGLAALIRLLETRTQALDLLMRTLRETSLGSVDSFVLPLRSGEGDIAAINGFATACLHRDRGSGKAGR